MNRSNEAVGKHTPPSDELFAAELRRRDDVYSKVLLKLEERYAHFGRESRTGIAADAIADCMMHVQSLRFKDPLPDACEIQPFAVINDALSARCEKLEAALEHIRTLRSSAFRTYREDTEEMRLIASDALLSEAAK